MYNNLIVGGIGEGLFWLVVVVITIVTQIIKANKKKLQSQQGEKESTESYTAPGEELRNFLENLTESPRQPSKPAIQISPLPPPVPPPVSISTIQQLQPARVHQPASPAQRWADRPVRPTAPKRKAPPPAPRQTPVRKKHTPTPELTPYSPVYQTKAADPIHAMRKAIGSDLVNRNTLRKAILLREIIGPPVALRH